MPPGDTVMMIRSISMLHTLLQLAGTPLTLFVDAVRVLQLCLHPSPALAAELQALIRRMACDNRTWGQERIANELLLKLGLRVSPRTVRKYMPKRLNHGREHGVPSQRWRTFVHNHAQAIVACDFCVVVTATFRLLYVFANMEHATRGTSCTAM
jgi:hypothetical protein